MYGYRNLPRLRRLAADRIFNILKCIAHDMQYHLRTVGDAMYAP